MSLSSIQFALDRFTTFGDLLKYLRRRAGYTQRELSIAVGYSDTQISRLEHNERMPDLATLTARFLPILELEDEPEVASRFLELATAVRREDAPAAGLPPYKGLPYFDETDSELFFGREALTQRLAARLTERADSDQRFLAVVGASGSGKSSVVRAGVISTLRWQPRSSGWPIFVTSPAAHPLESLATVLQGEAQTGLPSRKLVDELAQQPQRLDQALQEAAESAVAAHTLLVVDQFEELFTLCRSEAEQSAFVQNLTTAACRPGGTAVILLVLRADFYAHCAQFDALRRLLAQHQEYIGPMTGDELRCAIEEPAQHGHWQFEPGLVDLLLYDVGAGSGQGPEPGALPLLSHALLAVWERRRGRTLTLSGYAASGGVRGAIAETAESVFYDQLDHDQRQVARQIFLRLTALGGDEAAADTRRRVSIDELPPRPEDQETVHQVLTALADARLVTTDRNAAEVAHEALIREWPTLRGWLEEDREGLRLHRQLTEASQAWDALRRDPSALYRGARLGQALEWAAQHEDEVNALERAFLEASQALAEREAREREAQRRRELEAAQTLADEQRRRAEAEAQRAEEQAEAARKLRRRAVLLGFALGALALLLLAAIGLGTMANRSAKEAQELTRLATSRELAAAAVNNLQLDPERSVLLALQALETADTLEARSALHRALPELHILRTIPAHAGGVPGIAISPDGKHVASTGVDAATKIWDAASGELLLTLPGDAGEWGYDVVYSPDGRRLASTWISQVMLWDAVSGERLFSLPGATDGTVRRLAFSPDGQRLAVASMDGLPRIWDLSTETELLSLAGHDQFSEAIAYSPDGKRVATGDVGGVVKIWDANGGEELLSFEHGGSIHGLAFNPDGAQLAVASDNARLGIWDTASGEPLFTLPVRSGIYDVAYMPDGERLIAGHQDGTTTVWDPYSGQQLLELAGHVSTVVSVASGPDNDLVATGGYDGTFKLWDISPGRELLTVEAHDEQVYDIAYTPDGAQIATAGFDGKAKLWDTAGGLLTRSLPPEDAAAGLSSLDLSRDGKILALASWDGTLYVVDLDKNELLLTVPAAMAPVTGMAVSADGKKLAAADWAGTARIVDIGSGDVLLTVYSKDELGVGMAISGLAFSPDSSYLFTAGDDDFVHQWDAQTGEELQRFDGSGLDLYGVAISPDGQFTAAGRQDGAVLIWDTASGELLHQLSAHAGLVLRVAFSHDGTKLASVGFDSLAKVWDVASGQELMTLYGGTGNVFAADFSPDDRHLAAAVGDGTVRVYTLEMEELKALARERVSRVLTAEECRIYLHSAECPDI